LQGRSPGTPIALDYLPWRRLGFQPGFEAFEKFRGNGSELFLPDNSRLDVVVDPLAPNVELRPVLINKEADQAPGEWIIQRAIPGHNAL
jgi:hypothetical protein